MLTSGCRTPPSCGASTCNTAMGQVRVCISECAQGQPPGVTSSRCLTDECVYDSPPSGGPFFVCTLGTHVCVDRDLVPDGIGTCEPAEGTFGDGCPGHEVDPTFCARGSYCRPFTASPPFPRPPGIDSRFRGQCVALFLSGDLCDGPFNQPTAISRRCEPGTACVAQGFGDPPVGSPSNAVCAVACPNGVNDCPCEAGQTQCPCAQDEYQCGLTPAREPYCFPCTANSATCDPSFPLCCDQASQCQSADEPIPVGPQCCHANGAACMADTDCCGSGVCSGGVCVGCAGAGQVPTAAGCCPSLGPVRGLWQRCRALGETVGPDGCCAPGSENRDGVCRPPCTMTDTICDGIDSDCDGRQDPDEWQAEACQGTIPGCGARQWDGFETCRDPDGTGPEPLAERCDDFSRRTSTACVWDFDQDRLVIGTSGSAFSFNCGDQLAFARRTCNASGLDPDCPPMGWCNDDLHRDSPRCWYVEDSWPSAREGGAIVDGAECSGRVCWDRGSIPPETRTDPGCPPTQAALRTAKEPPATDAGTERDSRDERGTRSRQRRGDHDGDDDERSQGHDEDSDHRIDEDDPDEDRADEDRASDDDGGDDDDGGSDHDRRVDEDQEEASP